jgi:hypothetical protein
MHLMTAGDLGAGYYLYLPKFDYMISFIRSFGL